MEQDRSVVYLFAFMFVCLFVCFLFVYLFVCLLSCLFVCFYLCLFVCGDDTRGRQRWNRPGGSKITILKRLSYDTGEDNGRLCSAMETNFSWQQLNECNFVIKLLR